MEAGKVEYKVGESIVWLITGYSHQRGSYRTLNSLMFSNILTSVDKIKKRGIAVAFVLHAFGATIKNIHNKILLLNLENESDHGSKYFV